MNFQLLQGFAMLVHCGVCHRDVKPGLKSKFFVIIFIMKLKYLKINNIYKKGNILKFDIVNEKN